MEVEQRLKKYWIKPGKEVAHREFPERKMIVEDILKKSEKIVIDSKTVEKQFIVGVDCHWFDENGRYDRGKFLTTELIEFGKNPKKKVLDFLLLFHHQTCNMFFELINNKVVATDQAMMDPLLKKIHEADKSKSKLAWNKAISYLFFVYDKNSHYKNVLLGDRKKMVSEDIIKDEDYYKKIEEHSDFELIIKKYNELQFTHNERLLDGLKRKIEEYLNFWNSISVVDKDNHKLLSDTLTASEGLLKLQERLERMVSKEALSRQVGDGESKLFEDA